MYGYYGILHFGLESLVFLMCFVMAQVSWYLYLRHHNRDIQYYAFGFVLIGLSGVIHSFNFSGNTAQGIMLLSKLLGYTLIYQSVKKSRHPLAETNPIQSLPVAITLSVLTPLFDVLNAIITGLTSYYIYKFRMPQKPLFSRRVYIAFAHISVSELLFAVSPESGIFWLLGHLLRLAGFSILTWMVLRIPRLRFVDKLHVVLRGLVLVTVLMVIVPLSIVILYNVKMNSFAAVERDSKRVQDYFDKDKEKVYSTLPIIANDSFLSNWLANPRERQDSRLLKVQMKFMLRDTGNDFLIVLDRFAVPVLNEGAGNFSIGKLQDNWIIDKAINGQRVVAVQGNVVSDFDIIGSAPVYKDNNVVGVIISGIKVDDKYLRRMKKGLQLDVSAYEGEQLVATSYDMSGLQRSHNPYSLNEGIFKQVYKNKQTHIGEIRFLDKPYYASISPIFGPRQQVLGLFINGSTGEEYEYQKSQILLAMILVTFPIVLIAWILGYRLSRSITRSVEALGNAAKQVTDGNLDVTVPPESSEELAELGKLFNRMTSKLKEIDTMKSDYYSFMSHEIRTPLTALRGAADTLLMEDDETMKPGQRKMLEIISNNAQRLGRLVDHFLQLAKLEAGKMDFNYAPMDMTLVVTRCIETFTPLAEKQKVSLSYETEHHLIKPWGDADWMTQVISNLISNAIKFTGEDGMITVFIRQDEYLFKLQGESVWAPGIEIEVRDSGVGIPPDELKHIFDKYHQVRSQQKNHQGTGLGLPICKYIIEEVHHGNIMAESIVGGGSRFKFQILLDFKKRLHEE